MSQYIYFFARVDGRFLNLGEFSRSSWLFQNCGAPFEAVREVSPSTFLRLKRELEEDIIRFDSKILAQKERKKEISEFNNSVSEKLVAIEGIDSLIEDLEYERDETKERLRFVDFLYQVTSSDLARIFAGIEIPSPTDEDIVT